MGFPALFEVKGGFKVAGAAAYLSGSGIPGSSGVTTTVGVGSQYLDTASGYLYQKFTSGSGTDKWKKFSTSDDVTDAANGLSWRVPGNLIDESAYANLAAAETAVNTGTIDGQTVLANDRILFTNITGGNKNVYLVTGTPGSGATLVEDSNTASKGDAIYIQNGTGAGKQYAYNGTIWVQQGGGAATELGFVKTFIGKSADGSETPDYSSSNVVADGDSLETAIGKLDDEMGAAISGQVARTQNPISDQDINLNIKALDAAIGGDAASTFYVDNADSVVANISALDVAIGDTANVANGYTRSAGTIANTNSVTANLKALDDSLGADQSIGTIILTGGSINNKIGRLDQVLGRASLEVQYAGSGGSTVTLDEVEVDAAGAVFWDVMITSTDPTTAIYTGSVRVITDARNATNADATAYEWNVFGELSIGTLTGLDLQVAMSGTGIAQKVKLTMALDVSVAEYAATVTRKVLKF